MAEDGGEMNPIEMKGRGKAGCKSTNITATPKRGTIMVVMPNGKQTKEQEQDAPKKLQTDTKKSLGAYFGIGTKKFLHHPRTEPSFDGSTEKSWAR